MVRDIDGAICSWLEQDGPTIQDYVLGQYVTNDPAGIRTHPYSTSSCVSRPLSAHACICSSKCYHIRTTNPLTYASVGTLNEVHSTSALVRKFLRKLTSQLFSRNTDIGEVWANMLHNVLASLVSAHGFSSTARTDPTCVYIALACSEL